MARSFFNKKSKGSVNRVQRASIEVPAVANCLVPLAQGIRGCILCRATRSRLDRMMLTREATAFTRGTADRVQGAVERLALG